MKDQTKLYEIVYNRRNDFFRNQGQYLVENYRKVYEERYPKQYKPVIADLQSVSHI